MLKIKKDLRNVCLGFGFVFSLGFLSSAQADMKYECKLGGKVVDMTRQQEREKLNGEVHCVKESGGQHGTERYIYKDGKKVEAEVEDFFGHTIHHYAGDKGQEREDGEQIEYFQGTKQIKKRTNEKMGQLAGTAEEFYPNGKLSMKQLYGQNDKGQWGYEKSAVGYLPDGRVRLIRCSAKKNENVDPNLCGFGGGSDVVLYDIHGQQRASVHMVDGKEASKETAVKETHDWDSSMDVGTVREPKAAKRQRQNNSDGSVTITDLYATGKPKRIYHLDPKGMFTGKDEEWFESGGKARSTTYDRGGASGKDLIVTESNCWWENGSPRSQIKKDGDTYSIKYFWDNKQLAQSGTYKQTGDQAFWSRNAVESLMSCDPSSYELTAVGKEQEWNKKGGKLAEHNYVDGKREGLDLAYEPDGAPGREAKAFEGTYKNDKLTHAKYYKAGILVREEEYFSDGSVKEIAH